MIFTFFPERWGDKEENRKEKKKKEFKKNYKGLPLVNSNSMFLIGKSSGLGRPPRGKKIK